MSVAAFEDDFDPSDEVAVARRLIEIKKLFGRSGLAELKIGASVRLEESGVILEVRPLSSATPEERAWIRFRCLFCGPTRSWSTEKEMRNAHKDESGMRNRRFGSKKLGESLGADLRGENHVWVRYSADAAGTVTALFSETEWKP